MRAFVEIEDFDHLSMKEIKKKKERLREIWGILGDQDRLPYVLLKPDYGEG